MTSATHCSALAGAREALDANEQVLRALEGHVDRLWCNGDADAAAAWAQIAADFAFRNHAGVFVSEPLERVLGAIGRARVGDAGAPVGARPRRVRRVLHVLTEGYATGGHTRLAWRWMEQDAAREHSVVLTQPRVPPPRELVAAAARTTVLDQEASLLERAVALRRLAAAFDVVVLHVHMFDVVPVLAFARAAGRPPVVFVDHADHLFWLGASVADVVTGCRPPASALAAERRGIAPERCVSLPVPLIERPLPSRQDARESLRIAPDRLVILSVAAPYKFSSVLSPSYLDVATHVLRALPEALLIAVGPNDTGEWSAAARAVDGRIMPVGVQVDTAPFLAAADVYLDSYPFSSNTAAAEAALAGLPVVSFAPDPERQGMLLTHDPGFESEILRGKSEDEIAAIIGELAADRERRLEIGRRTRAGSIAAHVGDGWQHALEAVYETALRLAPTEGVAAVARTPAAFEEIHHLLFKASGDARSLAGSIAEHAGVLPERARPASAAERHAVAGRIEQGGERHRGYGIAAPELSAPAVEGLVAAFRRLAASGTVRAFVVALPPARLEEGVALLRSALDGDEALAIDVVPTDEPLRLVRAGDVWVGPAAAPQTVAATEAQVPTVSYA